ncbi:hypothetical protein OGAPHI_006033 [Ogataea philodendri]|uniref:Uncharacterized protein n=1 Tax=Ogataea philodendri TaxID=1378263 RepID=A0A9P8NYL2_9ASCO|nr:uncharacterized protein OGAPHI_006033 [Ogataea philodendri]KAH3661854.1 hypothetical protein OGAPHI_006033 [Ogataea philodendri]
MVIRLIGNELFLHRLKGLLVAWLDQSVQFWNQQLVEIPQIVCGLGTTFIDGAWLPVLDVLESFGVVDQNAQHTVDEIGVDPLHGGQKQVILDRSFLAQFGNILLQVALEIDAVGQRGQHRRVRRDEPKRVQVKQVFVQVLVKVDFGAGHAELRARGVEYKSQLLYSRFRKYGIGFSSTPSSSSFLIVGRNDWSVCALESSTFSICTFPSFSHNCFLYPDKMSSTSSQILSRTGLLLGLFRKDAWYTFFPELYSVKIESKSPIETNSVNFFGRSSNTLLFVSNERKFSISFARSSPSRTGFNIIVDETFALAIDSLRFETFSDKLLIEYSLRALKALESTKYLVFLGSLESSITSLSINSSRTDSWNPRGSPTFNADRRLCATGSSGWSVRNLLSCSLGIFLAISSRSMSSSCTIGFDPVDAPA